MKQLIKFCIVGCLNFGISYAVFFLSYRYWPLSSLLTALPADGAALLRRLGVSSMDGAVANVLGYSAGMANSFVWNRIWTFKAVEDAQTQAFKFIVTNIGCLLLSTAAVFVFTDLHHWPYKPVWFITMTLVTIINFVASKYWVFKTNQRHASHG